MFEVVITLDESTRLTRDVSADGDILGEDFPDCEYILNKDLQ